jgi:hypothetical protein
MLLDFSTSGYFDTKIQVGADRGMHIWFGNAWVLVKAADPAKGVTDMQGNLYRFDVAKGTWSRNPSGSGASQPAPEPMTTTTSSTASGISTQPARPAR